MFLKYFPSLAAAATTLPISRSVFCCRRCSGLSSHIYLLNSTIARDIATALFRIYQEALTNVIRHAEATEVRLNLSSGNGTITMTIQDNGRGILETQVTDPHSFGLMGMRERVYSLGGDVTIGRREIKGTEIMVTIPLTVRETAHD